MNCLQGSLLLGNGALTNGAKKRQTLGRGRGTHFVYCCFFFLFVFVRGRSFSFYYLLVCLDFFFAPPPLWCTKEQVLSLNEEGETEKESWTREERRERCRDPESEEDVGDTTKKERNPICTVVAMLHVYAPVDDNAGKGRKKKEMAIKRRF